MSHIFRDLQADVVLLLVSKRISILCGQDHYIEIMKHDIGENFASTQPANSASPSRWNGLYLAFVSAQESIY